MRTDTRTGRGLPDLASIAGFADAMGRDWDRVRVTPRVVPGAREATAAHRARLSERFPGRALEVRSGGAFPRNGDQLFPFRPDSDLVWLTGCTAPDAVLVLRPSGAGHDAVLYLPTPILPGEPGFIDDVNRSELWVGPAPALSDWAEALDIRVLPLSELVPDPARLLGGRAPGTSGELVTALAELRLVKDDWELARLREAIESTVRGFAALAADLPTAVALADRGLSGERWLQGTFDRHARLLGNRTGYGTIVAGGSHAATLHWDRADGAVVPGELLLVDAGVEDTSLYTADVSRTFPVDGRFTDPQRAVYELVHAAHRAAMEAVSPGSTHVQLLEAAGEVIARGLHDWDLLPVSVDEAMSESGQHHRRYLVCGIGHHLGLDVHDCGAAAHELRPDSALEQGMVVTIEPGLYFHAHDLTVPPELRGIGVRSEDDVLVTAGGHENLSVAMPTEADALAAWIAAQLGNPPV